MNKDNKRYFKKKYRKFFKSGNKVVKTTDNLKYYMENYRRLTEEIDKKYFVFFDEGCYVEFIKVLGRMQINLCNSYALHVERNIYVHLAGINFESYSKIKWLIPEYYGEEVVKQEEIDFLAEMFYM